MLFDISHHDCMNLAEKLFLVDLQSEMKYPMGGMYANLSEKQERKPKRVSKEVEQQAKEEERKNNAAESATKSGEVVLKLNHLKMRHLEKSMPASLNLQDVQK